MEDSSDQAAPNEVLAFELKTLRLSSPFRIAHGTSRERQVLRVTAGGGLGEAPIVPYYDEDPSAALDWLGQWDCYGDWLPAQLHEAPRLARLALDVLQHDRARRYRALRTLTAWNSLRAVLKFAIEASTMPGSKACTTS